MAVCLAGAAQGADPQKYDVDFASTGNGALDATLKATSELNSLKPSGPVSPYGLIARARGESDRFKTVLESFGYYQSSVNIRIDGLGLNDPGLGDALTALPPARSAHVSIEFDVGPLYHLRNVTVDGSLPASVPGGLTLKSGAPAVAADVLNAGTRLQTALEDQGYAFAKVDPPVAYEDQHDPVLDVSFHVVTGAQVAIGEIRLEGLQRMREKFVRRLITLKTGQRYSPAAIERTRRDLLALGTFGAISVSTGTAVDSTGGVPVTFQFRERRRHLVTLTAAYSSDLGTSGGVTWTDRNVFGSAEQLTLAAQVINLGGGSATTGIGYDTSAKLLIPDFVRTDQSLQVAVGAIKQSLQAYDQEAVTTGVTLNRKLSSVWTASVGVTTTNEKILQEGVNYHYTLVALPLGIAYDSTHLASPLDDPTHGMRDSLSVTPTRALGDPSTSFVISQIKLAAYFDLSGWFATVPGRSVIATRVLAGLAKGAGEFSLPPDQRFYGGGSGTIRGYPYQSVGPQFADGNPIGGTTIAAATVEVRQRFGQSVGAALFADAGQVSSSQQIVPDVFRIGVGVGLRYYTPIGPVRLDIAVPTQKLNADHDSFEVYVGLGQAF